MIHLAIHLYISNTTSRVQHLSYHARFFKDLLSQLQCACSKP
jgi:hypothetical protein